MGIKHAILRNRQIPSNLFIRSLSSSFFIMLDGSSRCITAVYRANTVLRREERRCNDTKILKYKEFFDDHPFRPECKSALARFILILCTLITA